MIIVSGILVIKEEKLDALKAIVEPLAAATRQEAGNVSYQFSVDLGDPTRIRIFEEWADEAALNSHFAQPHMMEFFAKMPDIEVVSTEVNRYDVASSSKLM